MYSAIKPTVKGCKKGTGLSITGRFLFKLTKGLLVAWQLNSCCEIKNFMFHISLIIQFIREDAFCFRWLQSGWGAFLPKKYYIKLYIYIYTLKKDTNVFSLVMKQTWFAAANYSLETSKPGKSIKTYWNPWVKTRNGAMTTKYIIRPMVEHITFDLRTVSQIHHIESYWYI